MTFRSYSPYLALPLCFVLGACSADPPPVSPANEAVAEPAATKPDVPKVAAARPAAQLLEPKRTFALVTGVLSWRDKNLAPFSAESRKDEQVFEVLGELGVPRDQRRLLLDDEATQGGMMATARALLERAEGGSTFLFYYAGHGIKTKNGKTYFACHDVRSSRPAKTGFSVEALGDLIIETFRGSRVVLLADCCYSGALAQLVDRLKAKGIEAVALTSAGASNTSTGNWTYSMTLLACLRGDALCDADGDGTTTLDELASEVGGAMKHYEQQRAGYEWTGLSPSLAVATVEEPAPLKADRRRVYVNIPKDDGWRPARLRSEDGAEATVRTLGYADHQDVKLALAKTRPIQFKTFEPGAEIQVYWGAKIYDAKVVRRDGDFHLITYPGWAPYWDEWLTSERIVGTDLANQVFAVGDAVSVQWRGTWYPASVLAQQGQRHHIHYQGYGRAWDEWVGPRRIRGR